MPSGVYIRSEKTLKNMSLLRTGKPGYWLGKKRSAEDRRKMGAPKKGKKQSAEHVEKRRLRAIGNKSTTGQKASVETRKKMSEMRKGEKHWNWRGGVSSENTKARLSVEYDLWRNAVYARDGYMCQKYGTVGGDLVAHHILNFSSHKELRLAIDNGVTLSIRAHKEFHKRYGSKNNTWEQINEFILETLLPKHKN